MPKPSHSIVQHLFANLFKVKSWVDLDRIQSSKRYIVEQCATYFVPGKKQKNESFDEAKARLKLTDQDISVRQQGVLRLSWIMVGAAVVMFINAMYNLFYAYYLALLISLVVMLLALVMAFRYNFWYFQMKHHRLGCSLQEWFMQGVLGVKDE